MPENTQIAPLDVPICSASFDFWWNDQENGCPTLVLDNDEQFARAVWNAAKEAALRECRKESFELLTERERCAAALNFYQHKPSNL
jgi:hypothetical protein